MKSLSAFIFFLLVAPATFAAETECDDISGVFRGICIETDYLGKVKRYDLEHAITQEKCEKVTVKLTGYPDEFSTTQRYDLTKGLTLMEDSEEVKILAGGTYGVPVGFAATLVWVYAEGNVDTVFTEFVKVKKSGKNFLKVRQHAAGTEMVCEVPEVKL